MITLVAALVLSQTPGTDEPAARALSPDFADCLALLEAGDQEGARACYAAHASPAAGEDERQAALARELADVVSTLRLPPPPEQLTAPRPANPLDVGALVTSGKAELIVWSALSGSFAAELTVWTAIVAVGAVMGTPAIAVGGLLLAPVVGGLAGLGLATTLVLALPGLTAGDANIVRAFLLLGLFDAVTFGVSAAARLRGLATARPWSRAWCWRRSPPPRSASAPRPRSTCPRVRAPRPSPGRCGRACSPSWSSTCSTDSRTAPRWCRR